MWPSYDGHIAFDILRAGAHNYICHGGDVAENRSMGYQCMITELHAVSTSACSSQDGDGSLPVAKYMDSSP